MINRHARPRPAVSGFSMIEVLIALVVLAFGLLGLALLQTMNLRYTQSAQQRTQAVNLASELLDMMRANAQSENMTIYAQIKPDSFDDVSAEGGCPITNLSLAPAVNIAHWRCEVKERLGGDASADVAVSLDKAVSVQVTWDDEFWTTKKLQDSGSIKLEAQL